MSDLAERQTPPAVGPGSAVDRLGGAYAWVKDYVPPAVGFCLFLVALWVLHHALQRTTYADLKHEIEGLAGWRVLVALAFTAVSFIALAGYEDLALRSIGKRLAWARAALVAFIAQSIGHSTGFSAFIGVGLRYRIYAANGLDLADVAKVQLFFSWTFALGVMLLSGLALVFEPHVAAAVIALPLGVWQTLGALLLLGVVVYLALSASGRFAVLRVRGHRLDLPPFGLTVAQISLAVADMAAAAAALYVLLPDMGVSFAAFLGMFTAAIIVGLLSNVPGALGVLESVLLLMLAPTAEQLPAVMGGMVVFRAVYYILPLLLGAVTLAGLEWRRSAEPVRRAFGVGLQAVSPMAPRLFAVLIFFGGVVLLASGALPAARVRLELIGDFLPHALIELSHFTGSLIGMALVLLAHSLDRRVGAAWVATVWLLAFGILVSLLKGFDYEEAIFLLVLLVSLVVSRREFYRTASLLREPLSLRWLLTVVLTLAATVWLVLFAYRHVDYTGELWWQFELHGNAPRSLRATLGAAVLLGAVGLTRLLRPAAVRPVLPIDGDLVAAQTIAARGGATTDWLALTGDKALLFNKRGDAFIMYGTVGRTWVAMGGPVGPQGAWPDLIWRFHEEAHKNGARTVFYEVPGGVLWHFLDLGLSTIKIGENAKVDLATFGLEGKRRAGLRHGHNRAKREGATFEILPPEAVPAHMDRLEAVSNAWLESHDTREKRFSLGFFEPGYVARTPVAVVKVGGEIKAFTNLWLAGDKSACSPDLMRFGDDAPKSVMDFLMIETMLWGKAEGYRWYELGMAPLSGLPAHRLAPLWSKLGRALYRHGGNFYNFEGLRAFKEKFDPVWEPFYLLYPQGSLARVLADTAALIAGGWTGVVRK